MTGTTATASAGRATRSSGSTSPTSYNDVALVAKGLAQAFYGPGPRYSYFNGVLAGAPASITTELNSVLHEYIFEANYTKPGYAGSTILDQPEATILDNAAIKACDPKSGIILDDRACEQKFNLNSVACSARLKSNCLTAAELAVVRKVLKGPVDQ